TLAQTGKIKRIPIVLYGREFWTPFTKLFEDHLFKRFNTVSEKDLSLYRMVDGVDEAYNYILKEVKC
ncbi:MAG: LOG family protein, partial [Patescibacteria group bacterium]|nr:LOG family protein [Patescibacteria group bacterium]